MLDNNHQLWLSITSFNILLAKIWHINMWIKTITCMARFYQPASYQLVAYAD
uniref:Uncharacterized protein n=1 Tax=Arundo donax TaxID=35708 RepID=A0A0A9BP16_ARUDO